MGNPIRGWIDIVVSDNIIPNKLVFLVLFLVSYQIQNIIIRLNKIAKLFGVVIIKKDSGKKGIRAIAGISLYLNSIFDKPK